LSLLGLHATDETSVLVQFSIGNARDGAWCFAEELSEKNDADALACIAERDKTVAQLAADLVNVKGFLRFTRWVIHVFEWGNPSRIIKALHEYRKKNLAYSAAGKAAISGMQHARTVIR